MSNQSIFELQLPEELLPFLDKINGNSINKKVRVAFAINLFAQKTVSLEKAAELSGETLIEFMDILKEQGLPWGEYTDEHLNQDKRVIKKMLKEMDSKK
ncbi:UPF0175 family protein [Desulfosporosinus sp.]|uniref:UPF0175 family protein n=1 Tax=Desulfosporosinus sp. TaxID=157907 RepID=UPI0023118E73|nr:UPF0175 family protein [Desulfosporosinus sp.]MDA8221978.1 UPF0175 family protein [Desulfitobacterium hafniense]